MELYYPDVEIILLLSHSLSHLSWDPYTATYMTLVVTRL
ncbi:hypothetical protein HMPREF9413_5695 [Paenibacillus sp. HGF7]|nr:hypothetical protein HMPREF9413_5695 [Paenibacillus sp. HGF7]